MEEKTWRGIMEGESWKRNHGGGIMTGGASGRHLGDILGTSGKHLGDILGSFERLLGGIWDQEASGRSKP